MNTNVCGTRWCTDRTETSDLMNTIEYAETYLWNELPWHLRNILDIVKLEIRRSGFDGVARVPFPSAGTTRYCSELHYLDTKDQARRFENIFDLNLHDAAVTYTYLDGEKESQLACTLWQLSRQLRVDQAREALKQ